MNPVVSMQTAMLVVPPEEECRYDKEGESIPEGSNGEAELCWHANSFEEVSWGREDIIDVFEPRSLAEPVAYDTERIGEERSCGGCDRSCPCW